MFDVTALGELLIDFTQSGMSQQNNQLFEANPGGAPCNVLAMLTNLNNKTAFIGKVGNDALGKELKRRVTDLGIDTSNLLLDESVNTTLAFVHNFENGDRDFSFYRNPGADMMLTPNEIDESLIANSRIFHFGTLSMTHEGVREATLKALETARKNGCLVSFDPNLREPLWQSLDQAKQAVLTGMEYTNILKISDNEIVWLTGEEDYDKAVAWIRERYAIDLILVTLGKDGSRAYYKDMIVAVPGFVRNDTIETTGAGDTFYGTSLDFVLKTGLDNFSEKSLKDMLLYGNAAASIITTRKGALTVMPTRGEIEALIKSNTL